MSDIQLIQLSNYVKPDIHEVYGRKWVLNGKNNCFFNYIVDRYNGSPTNESIINVYKTLLYGRGIVIKGQDELYEELNEIFPKNEQRKVLNDLKMFGEFSAKLVRSVGGGIAMIKHFPINKIGKGKANDKGVIDKVYYCYDWSNTTKYKPQELPVFMGKMSEKEMILLGQPYQPNCFYFANPDYMAGLQYAEIEEEISNFSINHIKNGLSFGYIINFNNGGDISPEDKAEIEHKIRQKLAGSSNAGKFIISFNNGKEAEVTIEKLDVNDAHNQWESLRDDAKYQILTTHGVTSPLLFGMASATGFGSNADELNTASKLLQDYQISPKQEQFLDFMKPVFELAGLETDLEFLPLRETYTDEVQEDVIEDEAVEDIEETVELSESYNDYPDAAKNNAKRALKWAEKNGWGSCGTSVGKKRASQIANGEKLSRDTISRMASFKRHQQHKDVPYSEGCGGLMWDAWGGSAGINWAISKLKKIDAKLSDDLYTYRPEQYNQYLQDFIAKGEDMQEDWELVDERDVDYDKEDEYDDEIMQANKGSLSIGQKIINLVSTGRANPNAKSEQDQVIGEDKYLVRYEYYPKTITADTRDFCKAMIQANKLYRKEDIVAMDNVPVNSGFGEFGANTYSIWLYKGGARCHHKWRRKTFKAKANDKVDTRSPLAKTISTNQAEREGFRVRNPREVAMKPKDMIGQGFSPNNPNTP